MIKELTKKKSSAIAAIVFFLSMLISTMVENSITKIIASSLLFLGYIPFMLRGKYPITIMATICLFCGIAINVFLYLLKIKYITV